MPLLNVTPLKLTIKFPNRKKIELNSIKQPNLLKKIIKIWYLISFVIKTIETEGLIFHFFRSKNILRFSKSAKTNQKKILKKNFPIVWTINIFFSNFFIHQKQINHIFSIILFIHFFHITDIIRYFFYHLINFSLFRSPPIPSLNSVENEKKIQIICGKKCEFDVRFLRVGHFRYKDEVFPI